MPYFRISLIALRLLALAARQAEAQERELSFHKATQWLLRHERFVKTFVARQFDTLARQLLVLPWQVAYKPERRRHSTRQLIAQQVGYLDGFSMSAGALDYDVDGEADLA